jgi:hypothetical protein
MRVFVVAERSLLADLIVLSLAPEPDLEVLWLTRPVPRMVSQAIREEDAVLILVEEKESKDMFITDHDLSGNGSCFRLITVSPEKHHLHIYDSYEKDHLRICDSYELPFAQMAQVIDLVRNFRRENLSEAAR